MKLSSRTLTINILRQHVYVPEAGALRHTPTGKLIQLPDANGYLDPNNPTPIRLLGVDLDARIVMWIIHHGRKPAHPVHFCRTHYTPYCPEVGFAERPYSGEMLSMQDLYDVRNLYLLTPTLEREINQTRTQADRLQKLREIASKLAPDTRRRVDRQPGMPFFTTDPETLRNHKVWLVPGESTARARMGVFLFRVLQNDLIKLTMHDTNYKLLRVLQRSWASGNPEKWVSSREVNRRQEFTELRDKFFGDYKTTYKGAVEQHERDMFHHILTHIIATERLYCESDAPNGHLKSAYASYKKLRNNLAVQRVNKDSMRSMLNRMETIVATQGKNLTPVLRNVIREEYTNPTTSHPTPDPTPTNTTLNSNVQNKGRVDE